MPKHDRNGCTAFEYGQETAIAGRTFDPFKFTDEYRQGQYKAGYQSEIDDLLTSRYINS